jgi:RNA polymerase sigma-70 factor (ECF subfamily)
MLFLILSALASSEDDRELIIRLKQRDAEAMSDLYDRFGRVALSIIVRIVRDMGVAEDLLQETFLRVWNRIASFDAERGALGPWVLTIARNRAIDYLRSTDWRHSQASSDLERLERPRLFVDIEEQYADRDRIRQIRDAFTKLSENQRNVLELAYFEGLSQSEMAERLKMPLGTVKTWVRTALQTLRQELGETLSPLPGGSVRQES